MSDAPSSSRRAFLRSSALASAALGAGWPFAALADGPGGRRKPLGVALLGLGKYSTGELGPALRRTKLCRLTGVISGVPEKALRWSREYGFPARNIYNYDNLERIADNPDIDIVYVVTPPGLHREFAVRAARAGKHVISEKPMATTVADCDAMIEACRKANVRLSIGYRLHFDPYHREMMRLARGRDFGVFTKMTGDRGFILRKRVWRVDKKLAGGGPMMDLGIYIVQGACMASNGQAPVSVFAHEEPKTNPELFNEVEETMRWTMQFADGAVCDAVAGFNHTADYFKVQGDRGWYELRLHAFTYRGITCVDSRGPVHYPPPDQQALQMDDFADCVLTGRPTPVPGEMGRRDIHILMSIYQAAATGQTVLL